ncbi:hypothetical protein E8E13_005356 [Curvularia kusanoi]|uniref:Uncharacterized protein n=1 Tax=Curvularia kusanoi TaxID=90978 RepID=A0A9P4WDA7_CURKU|nr:hypothetical protein E8E13_005356 [Curvularia kusanoi]
MKPSDPNRPSSRRGASGAWNRLKPVREDVLESYGLPSKGETRLNDFRTQETFLNRITERYMKLCALNRTDLESLFAAADPNPVPTGLTSSFSRLSMSKHAPQQPKPAPLSGLNSPGLVAASKLSAQELATVLSALRKLREGGDLAGARETKVRFGYKDRRVEMLLGALVSDNWVLFWRAKRGVDGYQRALCGFAEQGVRLNALKVIGKSYLVCDRRWIEDATGKEWDGLVADGVGWELEEGGRVVVRRVKAKVPG